MLEKKNIYKNVKKHLNYRAKELYIKVDDILKNPMIYAVKLRSQEGKIAR